MKRTESFVHCTALLCAIPALLHVALLAWIAFRQSPTWDEVGHFPAGITHWHWARFECYRVNPPLVRLIATAPVAVAGLQFEWGEIRDLEGWRPEFVLGRRLFGLDADQWLWPLIVARWACIPFSLIGAYVCWRWAGQLYGKASAVMALALWCFSPTVIGHGALMTPDAGSAALAVAAGYMFWKWLKQPTWYRAFQAGLVLGLAQLTKFTLIVFFGLWPLLWLVWRLGSGRRSRGRPDGDQAPGSLQTAAAGTGRPTLQIAAMLLPALCVINLGYGFEGSFQRLGDYGFVSQVFGGPPPGAGTLAIRNRFEGTFLGSLPVPLPKNYLMGIDRQRLDFELRRSSYVRGEWRKGGWWYYYIYALLIKEPLGSWLLGLLALDALVVQRGYSAGWRSELVLLAPLAVVLALVSSQTGFNHHLRYVLPVFPFAFIWISKVARAVELGNRKLATVAMAALAWSVASSLWVYPHSLSYFNELVGGPRNGHYHLVNSNIDWGQDLFYLKRWLDNNPHARPITLAHDMPLIDPALAGIDYIGRPPYHHPRTGWHVVSVNQIQGPSGEYRYFLQLKPVGMAGYSLYIYHITADEVDQ